MRVLLDENIDKRMKAFFDSSFDVLTVTEKGWQGTKNGKLLRLAAQEFDAFVTMDKNLQHQQNLVDSALIIIVIRAFSNALPVTSSLMPRVNQALRSASEGTVIQIKQT